VDAWTGQIPAQVPPMESRLGAIEPGIAAQLADADRRVGVANQCKEKDDTPSLLRTVWLLG